MSREGDRRDRSAALGPASRAFLRLSHGALALEDERPSRVRRLAALVLAALMLIALPLLWATSGPGVEKAQAVQASKGSSGLDGDDDGSGPDGGDTDTGDDGPDSDTGTSSSDSTGTGGTTVGTAETDDDANSASTTGTGSSGSSDDDARGYPVPPGGGPVVVV